MGTAIIILSILGVILVIIAFTKTFENEFYGSAMLGCGIGIMFSMVIIVILYTLSIHPIDVYRGKTTLEITYQDSIPIDSVVVYKNK